MEEILGTNTLIKFWLYIVCAGAIFGFINALAFVFAPLVTVATVSVTLAYFWVITRVDGPLWEIMTMPEAGE